MRVIVAGAGQMGSLYAAAFSENGHETTLFDRNSEMVTAVRTRGLVIDRRDGHSDTYRLSATDDPANLKPGADLVLFMVKGHATRDAAESVRLAADRHSVILTLQNGLGNEEVLRDVFPANELLIGMSVHSVVTLEPGHYHHTGIRETYLGPSGSPSMAAARRVASAMEGPSFPVEVLPEDEIRRHQWGKFVSNCATLPVSALTGLPTDVLKEQPDACALMDDLVRETCRIAKAEGIDLDGDERVAFLHDLLERAGGRASMLGDVLSRRKTEIETINGAALRFAERHGIEAPLNRAMYALVTGLENSFQTGEGLD